MTITGIADFVRRLSEGKVPTFSLNPAIYNYCTVFYEFYGSSKLSISANKHKNLETETLSCAGLNSLRPLFDEMRNDVDWKECWTPFSQPINFNFYGKCIVISVPHSQADFESNRFRFVDAKVGIATRLAMSTRWWTSQRVIFFHFHNICVNIKTFMKNYVVVS